MAKKPQKIEVEFNYSLGQLYRDEEKDGLKTMYSFDRVAHLFWHAFAEELMRRGLTQDQAVEELQSKGTRWHLDSHAEKIRELAEGMAKEYDPCVVEIPAKEQPC